jgi:hypothetical protein
MITMSGPVATAINMYWDAQTAETRGIGGCRHPEFAPRYATPHSSLTKTGLVILNLSIGSIYKAKMLTIGRYTCPRLSLPAVGGI